MVMIQLQCGLQTRLLILDGTVERRANIELSPMNDALSLLLAARLRVRITGWLVVEISAIEPILRYTNQYVREHSLGAETHVEEDPDKNVAVVLQVCSKLISSVAEYLASVREQVVSSLVVVLGGQI